MIQPLYIAGARVVWISGAGQVFAVVRPFGSAHRSDEIEHDGRWVRRRDYEHLRCRGARGLQRGCFGGRWREGDRR